MAFDLSSITTRKRGRPPRILVYGGPGIGKSTWAAGSIAPVFLPTENGLDALEVAAFPRISSWDDLKAALVTLTAEAHEFRTCVLDSADWANLFLQEQICSEDGSKTINQAQGGYGAGLEALANLWREVLAAFDYMRDELNMGIIVICHAKISKMEPPDNDPYDYWDLKLPKSISALLEEWADIIGFCNLQTMVTTKKLGNKEKSRAKSTGGRFINFGLNPAYKAESRYPLPDRLPLDFAAFEEALASSITPPTTTKKGKKKNG